MHNPLQGDNYTPLRYQDHVYFVHPLTDVSVDISTDSRPTYRSTDRPSLNRYVGQHIGRSTYRLICWSICRPRRCVARYIGQHIGRASVDMSTDIRPICQSICRPRVFVRLLADMSIDRLPTFRRYFTATCVLMTVDII